MKFGKQLEEYELPEWRGHYIPYKALKKRLEEISGAPQTPNTPASPAPVATPPWAKGGRSTPALGLSLLASDGSQERGGSVPVWRAWLESEAVRVGEFVTRGLAGLEAQLADLSKTAESLQASAGGAGADAEAADLELRVLEALGRVSEGEHRLRSFAELNHAALYKILKKHDKLLHSKEGLAGGGKGEGMFAKLVERTRLGDKGPFDALAEELKRLSLQSHLIEGLDASPEVARLAAGLGHHGHRAAAGNTTNELVVCFFLGSSVALFLSIGVLLALPEESPHSFSKAYFLTPMPVFRVVLSVLLSLWCMGLIARTCDKADINHMFILRVDPRCRVKPEFFFSRAATLTTSWILLLGMYVVDYKWKVLPTVWAKEGYNKRSSFHFVLYPIALIVLTVVGMIWPSRICRNRYKGAVIRSVGRTACAPCYPVDFADNIVGDVLTSLAKPLQDVPAACCYLFSSHPQDPKRVHRFVEKGDSCSNTTHHVLLPIIAGLPYVFRAFQCLRRFRDTREKRHLWNFGKYLSSLLVVFVSSVFYNSTELVIVTSAVATIYAGIWDVTLDWGLGRRELLQGMAGLPEAFDRGAPDNAATEAGCRAQPARAEPERRHFPSRTYWICSVVDLLARSTWVLTLMPITIITGSIVGRVVLVSIISSIEIVRRSMWAVLRIEYEQVANASGFRALLWVPTKLNRASQQRSA